jgi:hypothetical protein
MSCEGRADAAPRNSAASHELNKKWVCVSVTATPRQGTGPSFKAINLWATDFFSTPCIQNVSNTETKQGSITK